MPIYSKLIDDSKILMKATKYDEVFLLGCRGCINESLAYTNGYPIFKYEVINGTRKEIPYGVSYEINRLRKLLKKQGIKTNSHVLDPNEDICMLSDKDAHQLKNVFGKTKVILAMCCPAGQNGLRIILGKKKKIISLTKVEGILCYSYQVNEDKSAIEIIHSKSRVISKAFNS